MPDTTRPTHLYIITDHNAVQHHLDSPPTAVLQKFGTYPPATTPLPNESTSILLLLLLVLYIIPLFLLQLRPAFPLS